MDILQLLLQPKTKLPNTEENIMNSNLQYDNKHQTSFCVNCGNQGHIFKFCTLPVCSYGLICFYKKKNMVKETPLVNNVFIFTLLKSEKRFWASLYEYAFVPGLSK